MPDEADLLALPSVQRLFTTATGKERETLEAFLDFFREAVPRKLDGLSDEDARRGLVPSSTTLAGLLRHLRIVEMNWFQRLLDGTPEDELPVAVDWADPDASFEPGPDDTVAELVARYREQCELSRRIASRYELDDTFAHPELGRASLRWTYVHMIDETARHAGHADILRELTDGRTGL